MCSIQVKNLDVSESVVFAEVGNTEALWHSFDVLDPKYL